MPDLGQNFNAEEAKEMGFKALPEGDYKMMIDSSEIKEASTGVGNSYLQLDMVVLEGPQQGSKFIARLNLWNSKPSAVEMASNELGAIQKAVGKPSCNNSDLLHNTPMIVTLKVTPPKGNYGEGNQATAYTAVGNTPAQSGAPVDSPARALVQQQATYEQQAPAQQNASVQHKAPPQAQQEEPPPWG